MFPLFIFSHSTIPVSHCWSFCFFLALMPVFPFSFPIFFPTSYFPLSRPALSCILCPSQRHSHLRIDNSPSSGHLVWKLTAPEDDSTQQNLYQTVYYINLISMSAFYTQTWLLHYVFLTFFYCFPNYQNCRGGKHCTLLLIRHLGYAKYAIDIFYKLICNMLSIKESLLLKGKMKCGRLISFHSICKIHSTDKKNKKIPRFL